MSSDQLTPNDPQVKARFDTFKGEVTKEAKFILTDRMPQKILYFNELVGKGRSLCDSYGCDVKDASEIGVDKDNPWVKFCADSVPDLPLSYPANAPEPENEHRPPAKRTKADAEQSALKQQQLGKGPVVYPTAFPAHPQIYKMTEEVKREVAELIEMAGSVKLFIQLNVPRIEGGNNFGVQIQEEAIQELGRVEDAAFGVCSAIVEYFTNRATLISKILKYPNVQDYKEALKELDEKKWILLKVTRIDMRNNYALLYDLLSKNWARVVKPRHSDGSVMIY